MVTIPSVSPERAERYAKLYREGRRGTISVIAGTPISVEIERQEAEATAKQEQIRIEEEKIKAEIEAKEIPTIPTTVSPTIAKSVLLGKQFQGTRFDPYVTPIRYAPEPEYYEGEGKISKYAQLKSKVFGEGEARRVFGRGEEFVIGAGGVFYGTGKLLVYDIPKSIVAGTTGKLAAESIVGTVESVGATIKAPTPRGLGQLAGLAAIPLVIKGVGRIGTRITGKVGERIGRVDISMGDARTIAYREAGRIRYGTEADVTLIKKGLIRDKTFEGKVRVKGAVEEFKLDKPISVKTRGVADVLATEGRKTLSEFKFESEVAGKKITGKGFELGVEIGEGKIAAVSAIEVGKKAYPPIKSISMISRVTDVPMRVTARGVLLPKSKAFEIYGLAARTASPRSLDGLRSSR